MRIRRNAGGPVSFCDWQVMLLGFAGMEPALKLGIDPRARKAEIVAIDRETGVITMQMPSGET